MSTAIKIRRSLACARCGKYSSAERMVYSTWTRYHYCIDIDACGRRARRRGR